MEIRKAGPRDLEIIYQERLVFVRSMRNFEINLSEDYLKNTYDYMKEHLEDNTLVAWLAEDNGVIIATAMVSYYQLIPMLSNPTGKTGYIINVHTKQEYRRQGIASQLLLNIIEDAKERNVGKLYLSATDMGKPVYEKLGFETLTNDMVYKIFK